MLLKSQSVEEEKETEFEETEGRRLKMRRTSDSGHESLKVTLQFNRQ